MSGAGLIVSTFHEGKIKYVLLQGKFQDEGYLDLPKGQVDKNEKIKDAAFREAFEEADIRKSQVSIITNEVYTPLNSSSLYLYLVYIPFERIADLKVKVNPKTRIKEHKEKIQLKTSEEGEKELLYYLRGSLIWADEFVKKYVNNLHK